MSFPSYLLAFLPPFLLLPETLEMVQSVLKEGKGWGTVRAGSSQPSSRASVAHSSAGQGRAHAPRAVALPPWPISGLFWAKRGDSVASFPTRACTHLLAQKLKNLTSCLLASAKDETRHSWAHREEGEGCESRKLLQDSHGARVGQAGRWEMSTQESVCGSVPTAPAASPGPARRW